MPFGEQMMKRLWKMIPAVLLCLLIIIIMIMYSRIRSESDRIKEEKMASLHSKRAPVNVVVLDVQPMPIRDRLDLPARVEAWLELNLFAEVAGEVEEVLKAEGDTVIQGDVIARIDSSDYENDLASIRAERDLAEKNLIRTKSLFGEGLTTRARLEADLSAFSRLEAAERNAELRLERCNIKAPISGLINRLDAKKGLFLSVQDPIALIINIEKVKVSVGIPESDVDAVRGITDFGITIDALDGRRVTGKRYFFSKSPEPAALLYKLELEVDNHEGRILPGMFARVNIVKHEVKESISVPLYAVITGGEEQFVFVERDGIAHRRLVETGILEGWRVQISKGLDLGDRVIVVGHRSLDEGQEVNVARSVRDPEDLFK